ncbi:protein of unknown function [Methylocella tundrae]|uniref:Uncharacterized protein n=1 Tax=Methylocella tundrae TaxID=227605 RepID=A0A4U8YWQ1_METTU|nr:protein of unknown function [Methylocella tundrae]
MALFCPRYAEAFAPLSPVRPIAFTPARFGAKENPRRLVAAIRTSPEHRGLSMIAAFILHFLCGAAA